MKRTIGAAVSLALLLGLLSGCAGETPITTRPAESSAETTAETTQDVTAPESETAGPAEGQTFGREITMPYYPDRSLNPYLSADYTNRTLMPLLYQGLFALDHAYHPVPVLCQRYTVSEDMKNHLFYLMPKAVFSDGDPVTAEDVAASLQAASQDGYYAGRFSHVDHISAPADGCVLIQTDCPYEDMAVLLDIPIVKQEQVAEASPLGTGPYRMNGAASLEKIENWWGGDLPFLTMEQIHLAEGGTPAEIRDQFEYGQINLVCVDPGTDSYAAYRCDFELWDCETGIFLYLGSNLDSPVFSNSKVRSALPMAIDRDLLTETLYQGFAVSTTLPASPRSDIYNIGLAAQYAYDPAVFRQAVEAAKLKDSTVTLLTNADDTLRCRAAQAIAGMLEAGGLKVELSELDSEAYVDALRMQEYDLYLGQTRLPPNMDLSEFFHEDGKLSFGPMNDPTMYALCLQALENSGNFYDLHQAVMNDGRLCPILMRGYAVYATRGLLSDLIPARDNIFFTDLGRTLEEAREQPKEPKPTEETTVPESSAPTQPTEPPVTDETQVEVP